MRKATIEEEKKQRFAAEMQRSGLQDQAVSCCRNLLVSAVLHSVRLQPSGCLSIIESD